MLNKVSPDLLEVTTAVYDLQGYRIALEVRSLPTGTKVLSHGLLLLFYLQPQFCILVFHRIDLPHKIPHIFTASITASVTPMWVLGDFQTLVTILEHVSLRGNTVIWFDSWKNTKHTVL